MVMNEGLLKILACPKCKGKLAIRGMFITCSKCGLAYPIIGGDVPDMLIEDAWKIKEAEKAGFKHDIKL